jgi:hypothetical protein
MLVVSVSLKKEISVSHVTDLSAIILSVRL